MKERVAIAVHCRCADVVTAFAFDPEARTLAFTGIFAAGLSFPHGLDACADGRYVAVTTYGDDSVHIARVPPGLTTGGPPAPSTHR